MIEQYNANKLNQKTLVDYGRLVSSIEANIVEYARSRSHIWTSPALIHFYNLLIQVLDRRKQIWFLMMSPVYLNEQCSPLSSGLKQLIRF